MSLAVCCVWVRGNVDYTAEYVTRLQRMVARHLALPHRFVCLTDQPWALAPPIDTIVIRSPTPLFGWWAKIQCFNPKRDFGDRVLYLDLDSLVVGDLEGIVNFPAPFALIPDAGHFTPRDHHQVVKRFNSSVMVWSRGAVDDLYAQWTPAVADRLWGDQDFVGEQRPEAAMLPLDWFPRLSAIREGPVPPDARVILAKKPKPARAAQQWPWVREAWGIT